MSLNVNIMDGLVNDSKARVTQFGQLVTSPIDYSTLITQSIASVNVAVNFVQPKQGHRIVVTDIMLQANKMVSGEAVVNIYTSDTGPDSLVIVEDIFTTEIIRQGSRDLVGLNVILEPGRWLNGKTDDDDINATIGFYYVPVIEPIKGLS